jgi:glycosyltransferase involved in cell wall biosynthesis
MLSVNYLTPYPSHQLSGGMDGTNHFLSIALRKYFNLTYTALPRPNPSLLRRTYVSAKRRMGLKRPFEPFSDKVLRQQQKNYQLSIKSADADFFFTATSWLAIEPKRPYFVYMDLDILTYVENYLSAQNFSPSDVNRICRLEANWINQASGVFFSSKWASERARKVYGNNFHNFSEVGIGGNLEGTPIDRYLDSKNLLFVATDFERKRGRLAYDAFALARKENPEITLTCIGIKPPKDILTSPGVLYEGYLSKDNPEQLARLKKLFAEAFLLLLPSSADATPVTIIEAGSFGCPSLGPRAFGITEILEGICHLMPLNAGASEYANAITDYLKNKDTYYLTRKKIKDRILKCWNWDSVSSRISFKIREALKTS